MKRNNKKKAVSILINRVSFKDTHKSKKMSTQKTVFQFGKFATLQSQLTTSTNKIFEISMAQGEILLSDVETFKTDEGKKFFADKGNAYPKIEDFINEYYKVQKSWAYKLMRAAKLEGEIVAKFRESGEALSIANLLKFAKGGESAEGEQSEGEQSEGEGEAVSEGKKDKSLRISVSAKGDIKIKGACKKEYITLLIEELKKLQ